MFNVKCAAKEVYARNLPRMARAAPWVLLICALLAGCIIGYSVKGIETVTTINQIRLAHQAELNRTIDLYRPFVTAAAEKVGDAAETVRESAEKVQKSSEVVKKAAETVERGSNAPLPR